MSAYLRQLQAHVDKGRAAQVTTIAAADRAAAAQAARERMTPLHERLSNLLATIPEEVQREGLSLPALQARLRGRRRETAHAGQVGEAMRRLGWRRERRWRGGDAGFSALWWPPAA